MPKRKAPKTHWLLEAWALTTVIGDMPEGPPGLLADFAKWPRDPEKTKKLEQLQDKLNEHLTHRINTQLGSLRQVSPGPFWTFSFRHPSIAIGAVELYRDLGVKFNNEDKNAIFAHASIGHVLIDGFLSGHLKARLPLVIASITGQSSICERNQYGPRSGQRQNRYAG
jgi:hypothetical protein